jgi:lysophospholipase L1-like esterase
MSVIVVFGDSNSWGYDPRTASRFPVGVRWPTVMQRELGSGYDVIEEALNGRTTIWNDPIEPHRSGIAYLTPCLMSHAPLDLVVIALGCNDLKKRFSLSPTDIAAGAERLVLEVQSLRVGPGGTVPKVILIAPPPLAKLTAFAEIFEGATEKAKLLGARYAAAAERCGVPVIDSGTHVHCSDLDGIHLEADQHRILGAVVAAQVRRTLAD